MRLAFLLALAGCSPALGSSSSALVTTRCGTVTDFGAIAGDGKPDEAAFQAAIDSCAGLGGGTVTVPTGVYTLARHQGWAYFTVGMADGVELRGESRYGSILELAPGTAASVSMFYTDGAVDAAITDLTLNGRKADQTVSEHRHAVFANGSERLRLERLNVRDFTGDGFYLYSGAVDTTINAVDVRDNDRNGLTMGGEVRGVSVTGSTFANSAAQQIDSEPGPPNTVSDVSVRGCTLSGGGSYALVIAGISATARGHSWDVVGNRIDGTVYVAWADKVTLVGNVIRNPNTHPAVFIYRATSQVVVSGNSIDLTHPTASSSAAVRVVATGVGQQPDDVVISGNAIRIAFASNSGIEIRGALRATVVGNTIIGAGPALYVSGIKIRSTVAMRAVIVANNMIRNFDSGISTTVNEPIGFLSFAGNVLDNGTTVGVTP